jgi:hypothetical protein
MLRKQPLNAEDAGDAGDSSVTLGVQIAFSIEVTVM